MGTVAWEETDRTLNSTMKEEFALYEAMNIEVRGIELLNLIIWLFKYCDTFIIYFLTMIVYVVWQSLLKAIQPTESVCACMFYRLVSVTPPAHSLRMVLLLLAKQGQGVHLRDHQPTTPAVPVLVHWGNRHRLSFNCPWLWLTPWPIPWLWLHCPWPWPTS